MYSEDSKKKVYYLLSDIVTLVVSYLILAQFYPYHLLIVNSLQLFLEFWL